MTNFILVSSVYITMATAHPLLLSSKTLTHAWTGDMFVYTARLYCSLTTNILSRSRINDRS